MAEFLAAYPTARLWTAGLFLGAALLLAPGLLLLRRAGGGSVLLGILPFTLWELFLLLALLGPQPGGVAGAWEFTLCAAALAVVPAGLALTLLVTGDGRLVAPACAAMGLGALLPLGDVAPRLAAAALLGLLGLLAPLFANGLWSAPAGYAAGAVTLALLGSLTALPVGEELAGLCVGTLDALLGGHVGVGDPWWLLALLLVPLIVLLSFRSLTGLGPIRRWVA